VELELIAIMTAYGFFVKRKIFVLLNIVLQ